MGWFSWDNGSSSDIGQQRYYDAYEFLNTGVVYTSHGGTGCHSSVECASGYACVGGRCTQIQQPGGQSSSGPCGSGPGSGGGASGPGTGGCSSSAATVSRNPSQGSNGGCTTSTCGSGNGQSSGYKDSDCCGERCCRFSANPSGPYPIVNCYCGPCPGQTGDRCGDGYAPCGPGLSCVNGYCTDAGSCNDFCDSYYKSNGNHSGGCTDDNVCSECEGCSNNTCSVDSPNAPCHCNPSKLPNCHSCNSDGTSSYDPANCLECSTIQNYPCPQCKKFVDATACQPIGTNGLSIVNKAQQAAYNKCAELCGPSTPFNPNRCAGDCVSKTIGPISGTCPDPDAPIPGCPDGADCSWSGCIQAGGQYSLLYYECDMSEVPDDCKACDCNCHDDCPTCYECNSKGECVPDPACCTDSSGTLHPRCYNQSTGAVGSCCNGFACRADGTCANKVRITVPAREHIYSITCACCCACEGRPSNCCYTPCGTETTGGQSAVVTLPNSKCRAFAEWVSRTTSTTPSGGTWACASGKTGYGGVLEYGYYDENNRRVALTPRLYFDGTYYETGTGCTNYSYYPNPPEVIIGQPE
jgi:hypothetical protein